MPIEYVADHARRRVTMRAVEPFAVADASEALERSAQEGVWAYSVLYDVRARTSALESQDVRRLASVLERLSRTHGRHGPTAVVVASDLQFGMARMFSALSEPSALTLTIVRSLEEAERWLDVHRPN